MAFLLAAPARRQRVARTAGMVRVGQVIEHNSWLNAVQKLFAGEQPAFDCLALVPDSVRSGVEGILGQVAGVQAEQFVQGRILLQPAQRLSLRSGVQCTGEDLCHAQAYIARAQSTVREAVLQADLASLLAEQASGADLAHLGVTQAGGQHGDGPLAGEVRARIVDDLEANVEVGL